MDSVVLAHGSGADDVGLLVVVVVGIIVAFVLAERASRQSQREKGTAPQPPAATSSSRDDG